MQTVETILVFAGIPAAVILVVTGLVYAGSARPSRRYRPGRAFDFTPVWYVSSSTPGSGPEAVLGRAESSSDEGTSGSQAPALTGTPLDSAATGQWPPSDPEQCRATGGASDRW